MFNQNLENQLTDKLVELEKLTGIKTEFKINYFTNTFEFGGEKGWDTFKIKPGMMDTYIKLRIKKLNMYADAAQGKIEAMELIAMQNTISLEAAKCYAD